MIKKHSNICLSVDREYENLKWVHLIGKQLFKTFYAGVAELVDALGLGPSSESCAGSSPVTRTISKRIFYI